MYWPSCSATLAPLGFVVSQIRAIEEARQKRLEQETETGPHAMVRLLAGVVGVGIETADMLVHAVLSRSMRDRKAVARYAGLTGSPDAERTGTVGTRAASADLRAMHRRAAEESDAGAHVYAPLDAGALDDSVADLGMGSPTKSNASSTRTRR
jgi:hypothetical protein